jgi:hypothetical protein
LEGDAPSAPKFPLRCETGTPRGIWFADYASAGYASLMSTVVLELKDKVERLTSEERHELMQILEDIEDNALADQAEARSEFISFQEYKKLSSEDQLV